MDLAFAESRVDVKYQAQFLRMVALRKRHLRHQIYPPKTPAALKIYVAQAGHN